MAKTVKPAVKKQTEKAPAKSAAPKKAAKKPVAKKAATKPKSATKAAAKPVKKAATKKAAATKTVVKSKTAAKKTVTKKQAVKKKAAVAEKKAVIKKSTPVTVKPSKPVIQYKKPVKKTGKEKTTPPSYEQAKSIVKTAIRKKQPGQVLPPPAETIHEPVFQPDPLRAFDKKASNLAMAKGDPHGKIHLSSKAKGSKPTPVKKPLWNK